MTKWGDTRHCHPDKKKLDILINTCNSRPVKSPRRLASQRASFFFQAHEELLRRSDLNPHRVRLTQERQQLDKVAVARYADEPSNCT